VSRNDQTREQSNADNGKKGIQNLNSQKVLKPGESFVNKIGFMDIPDEARFR
jgi:hypothetical protein